MTTPSWLADLRRRLRNKPLRRRLFKLAGLLRGETMWRELRAYCLFVGYTRSGHSAIGSVIDAHPQAVVSHELNAVRRYVSGIGRTELFLEIYWLAREQARSGRRSNKVDGGTYLHRIEGHVTPAPTGVRLIGDKKGALTTRLLDQYGLDRLETFKAFVGLPVKLLHVVRNPYDMVAAAMANDGVERDYSFLPLVPIAARIRERCMGPDWLDVYHEDVIADPRGQITRIVEFLGLGASDEYLDRCAAYFYSSSHRRRFEVEWDAGLKQRVAETIDCYDFLRRYSWES